MQMILKFITLTLVVSAICAHDFDVIDSFDRIAQDPDLYEKVTKFLMKIGFAYNTLFYRERAIFSNGSEQQTINTCKKDFLYITEAVLEGKSWPFKFLDSSGKMPPGLSGGDLTWIGSFEMCNQIVTDFNSSSGAPLRGRYCNLRIPILIDDPDVAIDVGITIGVCLPSDCSSQDLVNLSEKVFGVGRIKIDERYTYCHQRREELPQDEFFTFAVVISCVVLAFVVIGSIMDVILYVKWKTSHLGQFKYLPSDSEPELHTFHPDSAATSTEPSTPSEAEQHLLELCPEFRLSFIDYRSGFFDKYCVCGAFFLVFSFPFNLWKLWQKRPNETVGSDGRMQVNPFTCLDGIRVITLAWIIYVHNFTYQTYYINNALMYKEEMKNDMGYQLIRNGSFSVDTFFLISGMLACYIFIPIMKHVKGCCRKIGFWAQYIFLRFIRIAPTWFFVTILFTGFFPYLTDGPLYPQNPQSNDELRGCRDHWWITFLNNFFYTDRPCMLWTWYLSNDFQFSVVLTPIFITLLGLHWVAGVLFAVSLVISSAVATFIITYQNEYGPSPIPLISFGRLYVKPYTRWGSYAIGMILGWLIRAHPVDERKYSVSKRFWITTAASIVAAAVASFVLFILYPSVHGDLPPINNIHASLYAAFSRPLWTLAVATAIYLCAIQFSPIVNAILSFQGFSVFSKLNYCAYLIHPILIMYHQQSKKRTQSFDNSYLIFSFSAIWVLSYLVSLVISLSTEVPVMILGKLLHRNRHGGNREQQN